MKDAFRFVTRVGQRKKFRGIEPKTFGFRAPMFYHGATDSTVCDVDYEVHMIRVLLTARISIVDSVMFVN